MSVKKYNWPFSRNPHTLLVQKDGDKWSFAICDANSHVFLTPDSAPEFIRLMPDKTIRKEFLKEEDVTA